MKLDFDENYELENDRVLLRPLQMADKHFFLPFSLGEPELWKFSLQGAAGHHNLEIYVNQAMDARSQQREYPFIVFDKRSNSCAGCTRFYDIQPAYKTLQLGYTWYGKAFQATGLNKNCKLLLLQFAFEKLLVERVEFRADNDNQKSIAAMRSIGCKVDGILRSNMPKPDNGRRDSIVLSILKDEWVNEVKTHLEAQVKAHSTNQPFL